MHPKSFYIYDNKLVRLSNRISYLVHIPACLAYRIQKTKVMSIRKLNIKIL